VVGRLLKKRVRSVSGPVIAVLATQRGEKPRWDKKQAPEIDLLYRIREKGGRTEKIVSCGKSLFLSWNWAEQVRRDDENEDPTGTREGPKEKRGNRPEGDALVGLKGKKKPQPCIYSQRNVRRSPINKERQTTCQSAIGAGLAVFLKEKKKGKGSEPSGGSFKDSVMGRGERPRLTKKLGHVFYLCHWGKKTREASTLGESPDERMQLEHVLRSPLALHQAPKITKRKTRRRVFERLVRAKKGNRDDSALLGGTSLTGAEKQTQI